MWTAGNEVKTPTNTELESRIVVGVDGSLCGWRALDFAIEEALRRGALLHVVCAYDLPTYAGAGGVAVSIEMFKEAAEAEVGLAMDRVQAIAPSLIAKSEVIQGRTGRTLVDESEDASLLVVGSRGRGEFASLLLGSTSAYCARHTRCPITVVH